MEVKFFRLAINFDSVETESFYVEFLSYSNTVSYLVRKILLYFDAKPIRSFVVSPVDEHTPSFSLMHSSNIDLFNYLIH